MWWLEICVTMSCGEEIIIERHPESQRIRHLKVCAGGY